jgi:hypothetical protein
MAIKKYNQFVKTNEEFVDTPSLDTKQAPTRPERGTETLPGRPGTTPSTRPSRPSVVPGKRPSEEDAPLASNDDEFVGTRKTKELLTELGPEAKLENGTIYYDGKEINFYSETEKFHIGRKRFDDVKDVLNFLGVKEDSAPVERDFEEELDPEFEAKSYRFTRKNKRLK